MKPPTFVWVSYCTRCGKPICADATKVETSCPYCPGTKSGGPRIAFESYMVCNRAILKKGRTK
jgi:hypothetical protein